MAGRAEQKRRAAAVRAVTPRADIESHLSWQAVEMLEELAATGLFGLTKEEVAARFIDDALVKKLGSFGLEVKTKKPRAFLDSK